MSSRFPVWHKCLFTNTFRILFALCLILVFTGSALCKDIIYVANKGGNPDVTLIDSDTMASVGSFDNASLSAAAGIAFSSDGTKAFLACSEGLAILNTSTLTSPTLTQLISAPQTMDVIGMAVTSNDGYAYILSSDRGVLVVNLSTKTVVSGAFVTIPDSAVGTSLLADTPRSRICVSTSNGQIYAASNGSTSFSKVLSEAAGLNFRTLALSPDGTSFLTASKPGTFSFVTISPPALDTSISLSNVGDRSCIKTISDNVTTLVSCTGNGTVAIINLDAVMYIGSATGFSEPGAIYWDSGSSRALVANTGSSTLSILDPTQASVTGTVAVGTSPWAMAARVSTVGEDFLISGTVRDSSSGAVMDVKVSVTGQDATYTDGDGKFLVMSLSNGTYTVTPSKEGWTFSPTSRTITLGPSAETVNFTGTAPQYLFTLAGKVTLNGSGLSGVSVSLSGSRTDATDTSGNFDFANLGPGTYTITPTHLDYDFEPTSITVTLGPNSSGNNFAATARVYSIAGQISDYQGQGIEGVTVEAGGLGSTKTGPSGAFSFSNVAKGSYTLTYTSDTYVLSPTSSSVTVPPAPSTIKVLGRSSSAETFGIGGIVMTAAGDPYPGVTVTLSGANLTRVTDSDGIFTFLELPAGTYTLTPAMTGVTFVPASDQATLGPDSIDNIFMASGEVVAQDPTVTCSVTPFSGYGEEKLTNGTKVFNSEFALKANGSNIEIVFDYPSGITVESITHVNDGQYGANSVDVLYAANSSSSFTTYKTFNLTITQDTPTTDTLQMGGIRAGVIKLVYKPAYLNDATWFQLGEITINQGTGTTTPTYQQKLTPIAVVSSSTAYPGYGTSKLYDGQAVFNGDFATKNDGGAVNLFVDLGGIHSISKVKLISDGQYGCSSVIVLYSDSIDNQFQALAEATDVPLTAGTTNSRELTFTEVQARFVQFYFGSGFGDASWFQMNELEVYGDPTSTGGGGTTTTIVQLTPRGATCNVSAWPGYGVDKLYNGSKVYNSEFAAQNNNAAVEMVFDLGATVSLQEIDHHNDGEFGANGVSVYYSTATDPATWTSLASVSDLTVTAGDVYTDVITLNPVECRFVKFRYTSFGNAQWFQLAEITFMGSVVQAATTTGQVTVSSGSSTPAAYQGYGVSRVYDGSLSYNDGFAVNNSGQPVEILLDLGSDQDFNLIDHYNDGEYGAGSVQISVATSAAPSTFSLIYSTSSLTLTAGQANLDSLSFSTANGKLVKFTYSQFNDPSWFQVAEIIIRKTTEASALVSASASLPVHLWDQSEEAGQSLLECFASLPPAQPLREAEQENVAGQASIQAFGSAQSFSAIRHLSASRPVTAEELSALILHLSNGGDILIDTGQKPGTLSDHDSGQVACHLLSLFGERAQGLLKGEKIPLSDLGEIGALCGDENSETWFLAFSPDRKASSDPQQVWAEVSALINLQSAEKRLVWLAAQKNLMTLDDQIVALLATGSGGNEELWTLVGKMISGIAESAGQSVVGAGMEQTDVSAGQGDSMEVPALLLRFIAARLEQWGVHPLGFLNFD